MKEKYEKTGTEFIHSDDEITTPNAIIPAKFIRPPWEKQKNPAFKYVFTIERSEKDSSYPYCILRWGMETRAVQGDLSGNTGHERHNYFYYLIKKYMKIYYIRAREKIYKYRKKSFQLCTCVRLSGICYTKVHIEFILISLLVSYWVHTPPVW